MKKKLQTPELLVRIARYFLWPNPVYRNTIK